MGSASTTSSPASELDYERAKKELNKAIQSDRTKAAVDIAVTGTLAVQPNGPAKVQTYSYLKHTNAFVQGANDGGISNGITQTAKSVGTTEITGAAASATIDGAQQAVTAGVESDTVKTGVDDANKNLSMPSEQAAEDTLAAVMSQGSDALKTRSSKDE
jgi:hypothetical protein